MSLIAMGCCAQPNQWKSIRMVQFSSLYILFYKLWSTLIYIMCSICTLTTLLNENGGYVSMTRIKTKDLLVGFDFGCWQYSHRRVLRREKVYCFVDLKIAMNTHHILTEWETEHNMKTYRASAVHLKAEKSFS